MDRRLFSIVAAGALVAVVAGNAAAQDESKAVAGGGISVAGWQGRIDAREAAAGQKLENTKLTKEGDALHAVTGPAVAYWHPNNKASGNYTVSWAHKLSPLSSLNVLATRLETRSPSDSRLDSTQSVVRVLLTRQLGRRTWGSLGARVDNFDGLGDLPDYREKALIATVAVTF